MEPMTMITIASIIWLGGTAIYHKYFDTPDKPEVKKLKETKIPAVEEGTAVPMVWGRTRVRQPILAWNGPASFEARGDYGGYYRMNMFFVVAMGFRSGNGITENTAINGVHGMWAGEKKFGADPNFDWMSVLDGHGDDAALTINITSTDDFIGGSVEVLIGTGAQVLESAGTASTFSGAVMMAASPIGTSTPGEEIPGYRGYMTVCCFQDGGVLAWSLGRSNTVQGYSFEVSSYRDSGDYPAPGVYAYSGLDANPVNVIYDLIIDDFAKLGLDGADFVDFASFQAAAFTCHSETNGYSRCVDSRTTAEELIREILMQIDGIIFEDPKTGKFKIKLIRNDYDITDIPHITRDNCDELVNLASSGWKGLTNKIRVTYVNRKDNYREASVTVQNLALAGEDTGEVREEVVDFPGVHEQALAWRLAGRELYARGRPFIKCRAVVDRTLIDVEPGDVVRVTWTEPNIPGVVFRVLNVNGGDLNDDDVELDLVQDLFYTFRRQLPQPPPWTTGLGTTITDVSPGFG